MLQDCRRPVRYDSKMDFRVIICFLKSIHLLLFIS
jgi:hypothetical protein